MRFCVCKDWLLPFSLAFVLGCSGATTLVAAPTGVSASPGVRSASVTWAASDGSAGYVVLQGGASGDFAPSAAEVSGTTAQVSGLSNGGSYRFVVVAVGAGGHGAPSAPSDLISLPDVPAPAAPPTAQAGIRSTTLTWSEPSGRGRPITAYTIQQSLGSGDFTQATATIAGTTAAVAGLVNGGSYRFTVTASNAVGVGTSSPPSAAIVLPDLPAAPATPTVTIGIRSAAVAWSASAANGSPILGYTLLQSTAGGPFSSATGTLAGTGTTVLGLANGGSYQFAVAATNAAGAGPTSVPSAPVVLPDVPGIPGSPAATAGIRSASLTWTAPAANGSPILDYPIQQSTDGVTWVPATATSSGNGGTVTGLTNAGTYRFNVSARNAAGIGAASAASAPVTLPDLPGAPTALSAQPGVASATLSWSAPASNGGRAISGYSVSVSPGSQVISATGTGTLVSGLATGLVYTGTVAAVTPVGTGPASAPLTFSALSPFLVSPPNEVVVAGHTAQFQGISGGSPATGATWSVQEAGGGSVDQTGLYTAPSATGFYHVVASRSGQTASSAVTVVALPTYPAAQNQCASMPLRSTGTIYYVCDCQTGAETGCVAGNDTATGNSPSTPWKTVAKAAQAVNTMKAGDTVAFCRGGFFTVSARSSLHNTACRADPVDMTAPASTSTCDVRDYTPPWGGLARPVISHSGSDMMFSFDVSGSSPDQGFRILNLDLRGNDVWPTPTGAGTHWAIWLYGERTDILLCGNSIDGWDIGLDVQSRSSPAPSDGRVKRLRVLGNSFTNNVGMGILGAWSNGAVDSNFFFKNGSTNVFDHSIYLSGEQGTAGEVISTNLSVTGNELVAGQTLAGSCAGVVLVVHGQWDGLVIDGNVIDGRANSGGACWGISLGPGGYPTAGFYRNAIIRRNLLLGTGNRAIDLQSTTNAIVEDNVIVMNQAGAGIAAGTAHRITPADDVNTGSVIRNNTIHFPASVANPQSSGYGISIGTEGTGYVVANNAILFSLGGFFCFDLPLPASAYAFVDYNLCSGVPSLAGWEFAKGSLAAWRTATGFDGHSLTSAPLFTTPPSDYTPQTSSPLLGAGDAAHAATVDFNNKSRPAPPSIGAIER